MKERLDLVTSFIIKLGVVDEETLSTEWEQLVSEMLDVAEAELDTPKLVLPSE